MQSTGHKISPTPYGAWKQATDIRSKGLPNNYIEVVDNLLHEPSRQRSQYQSLEATIN